MAKHAAALAFLLLAALASEASSVRTTVIIEEAENVIGRGSCTQQLQDQGYLNHCQQYLVQEAGRETRGWSTWGQQDPQGHFNMCCNQLRRMDSECTCMGLERAVEAMLQLKQRGLQTWGTLDVQSAQRLAETLPGKCVSSPASCRISIRSTSF